MKRVSLGKKSNSMFSDAPEGLGLSAPPAPGLPASTQAPPQWGTPRRWGANPQNTPRHLRLSSYTDGQPPGPRPSRQGCCGVQRFPDQTLRGDMLKAAALSQGHEMGGIDEDTTFVAEEAQAQGRGSTGPSSQPVPPTGPARHSPDRLKERGPPLSPLTPTLRGRAPAGPGQLHSAPWWLAKIPAGQRSRRERLLPSSPGTSNQEEQLRKENQAQTWTPR